MVGETCQGAACVHVLVRPLVGVLWKPRSITVPVGTLVSLLERDWNGQVTQLFSHGQGDMVLGLSPACLQNQISRPTAPPPAPHFVPSGWRQLMFGIICIKPSDANQRLCIQHISLYAAGVQCRWWRASVTMDFLCFEIFPGELWSIMGNVVCEAMYFNSVNLKIGCWDSV